MRSFAELFKGRDDAYGYYGSIAGAKPTARGKRTGMAATRKGAVTEDLYLDHLAGRNRLGIVTVCKDGKVWWFCLDVDFYQEKGLHEDIAQRIKECGLPLVQTRSKSGGAHLWCFLEEPIPASKARTIAEGFRKKLRLPDEHIDIFPIQDGRGKRADDIGNWVNIPYFGDACHCTGEDGTGNLTLEEFLEYANARIVHLSDLNIKFREDAKASVSSIPPCIEWMMEEGVPEGYRSNALTHFSVYAKRAFPDSWKEKVHEFNQEHVIEPMDKHEMASIIKSAATHEYQYLCDKIKTLHCDKAACKKREFGVGGTNTEVAIDIEKIEKIDGEEPVYRVTIDGIRFQCNLEEMFTYNLFKKRAFAALNRFLPVLKQPEWEQFAQDIVQQMEVEEAAADTQMRDRVIRVFQRFAENCTMESLEAAVTNGLPYYDGKNIIFRGDEFLQRIDQRITKLPREKTWAYMRDYGTVMVEYTIDGKRMPFWCYVVNGPLWFDPEKGAQV